MNIFDLLQLLHPDLAEWERRRRLRKMPMDKGELYLDGPVGARNNGVAMPIPHIPNWSPDALDPNTIGDYLNIFPLPNYPIQKKSLRDITKQDKQI